LVKEVVKSIDISFSGTADFEIDDGGSPFITE